MVVRMRATRGHTGNRRSHHALKSPRLTLDTQTGAVHERHRVSMETGVYRGKKIFDAEAKAKKLEARAERKAKARGEDPDKQ
jgi:large subunit ribosomal protein L32